MDKYRAFLSNLMMLDYDIDIKLYDCINKTNNVSTDLMRFPYLWSTYKTISGPHKIAPDI